jgi:DNA repair and recombination protein RAD52
MNPEIQAKLEKPLDQSRVKSREGANKKVYSYLESHDIERTANDIFGYGNWSSDIVGEPKCVGEEEYEFTVKHDDGTKTKKQGKRVGYTAVVRVTVDDATYTDVGYGDSQGYDGSTVKLHELASKEAVSDAEKRAFKHLGDQFGLCLWNKDSTENKQAPKSNQSYAKPTQPSTGFAEGGAFVYQHGKHKGKTVSEVENDGITRGYAEWSLKNYTPRDEYGRKFLEACDLFVNGPKKDIVQDLKDNLDAIEDIPF